MILDQETFYNKHKKLVYNIARKYMCNTEDVEDAVQDTFLKIFERNQEIRGDVNHYLMRCTANTCLTKKGYKSATRDRTKMQLYSIDDPVIMIHPMISLYNTINKNPETVYLRSEKSTVIRSAINNLSLKHKDVIVKYTFQEKTYEQIAEELKVPIGSVKSRVFRARQYLQLALAPYFCIQGDV